MLNNGPAAATRGRTALGDISNRKYSQLADGKVGAKVRASAAPAPTPLRVSAHVLVPHMPRHRLTSLAACAGGAEGC